MSGTRPRHAADDDDPTVTVRPTGGGPDGPAPPDPAAPAARFADAGPRRYVPGRR